MLRLTRIALFPNFNNIRACSVAGGLDSSRLEQVEALARDAAKGTLTAQEADSRLIAIVAQKPM